MEYVPGAVVRHHYEFSRNQRKLYLLERNRAILLLTTYQRRSLLVLAPMLLLTEMLMLGAAIAGGWGRAKLRGWGWLWRHRDWVRARRALIQGERGARLGDLPQADGAYRSGQRRRPARGRHLQRGHERVLVLGRKLL